MSTTPFRHAMTLDIHGEFSCQNHLRTRSSSAPLPR